MMNSYCAFNLTIASELVLPALTPASEVNADVTIRMGDVAENGLENAVVERPFSQISPGYVWLHIPNIARFLMTNGSLITVNPYPGCDEQALRLFLMGSCMGAILHQRNQLVLHASAVALNDEYGVAFAGVSGAGKSTLAAAFHQRGFPILGDDLTVIDEQHRVVPSYPRVKLWHDALDKLAIDNDRLDRIRVQIDKYSYPINDGFSQRPVPLRAVYILQSHNQPEFLVEPVTGFKKFNPLKNNTYRVGYLEGLGLNPAHLKRCSDLAGNINLTRVTRPQAGFRLDELVDLILDDLDYVQP